MIDEPLAAHPHACQELILYLRAKAAERAARREARRKKK